MIPGCNDNHVRFFRAVAGLIVVGLVLAGCATAEEKALGKVARAAGSRAVTVYWGDINRKYRVIKKVSEKRTQIPGPNYYDHTDGAAWVALLGAEAGADAVIRFDTRRIPGPIPLITVGEYEAWGTAVKFVD